MGMLVGLPSRNFDTRRRREHYDEPRDSPESSSQTDRRRLGLQPAPGGSHVRPSPGPGQPQQRPNATNLHRYPSHSRGHGRASARNFTEKRDEQTFTGTSDSVSVKSEPTLAEWGSLKASLPQGYCLVQVHPLVD